MRYFKDFSTVYKNLQIFKKKNDFRETSACVSVPRPDKCTALTKTEAIKEEVVICGTPRTTQMALRKRKKHSGERGQEKDI